MSDITAAIEQQAVADSLIDRDPETNGSLGTVDELYERTENSVTQSIADDYGQSQERDTPDEYRAAVEQVEREPQMEYGQYKDLADEGEAELQEFEEQKAQQESQPEQPQGEQSHYLGLQHYEQLCKEYGLNDPEDAQELATDFISAFGVDPKLAAEMDVPQFQSTLGRTGLSLSSLYVAAGGDPSNLPQYDMQAIGQSWGNEFLSSFSDPRSIPFDAAMLGDVIVKAAWNVVDSWHRLGRPDTLDPMQFNQPDVAVAFWQRFLECFGNSNPADRAQAVKVSDVFARGILTPLITLAHQPKKVSSKPSASKSTGRKAAPKFQTNSDIFDDEAMDLYQTYDGRLILDSER